MQRGFLLVKSGEVGVFTTTKGKALLTTTTGALPRPNWYTENLRGIPLSQGFSRLAYREQHLDTLACHVAAQHRAGIDIFVDGDTRLDDDVAGRGWVSYATARLQGDRDDDRPAGEDRLDLSTDPGADANRRALQRPAPIADGPVRCAEPR